MSNNRITCQPHYLALMKILKSCGDVMLPCATPVLKVMVALSLSFRASRTETVWAAWIKLKEIFVEYRRTRDEEERDEAMSEAAKQKRESDAR